MLIDDEKFMRTLNERTLKDLGVSHITPAENRAECFKMLKRYKDDIDMVICDVEMPVMNGLDFVQKVRSSEDDLEDSEVPILMLAGQDSDKNAQGTRVRGGD